tara:strand:+ start:93 stop:731 length:639 start_codon:yes stop_codon:yes gene_type:complete
MMQGKYVTAEAIAAKITRDYKNLDFDFYDVVEWCVEAENNIAEFEQFIQYRNVPIDIIDKKALLPCNVYRLLHVRGHNCTVLNYDNNGTYLLFGDNSVTNSRNIPTSIPAHGTLTLHIDYLGVPTDLESGFPLIKDGHQEACYWYCLKKLLLPSFMEGAIPENRYRYIDEQYGHYVTKAKSSFRFTSRDDMERMMMIRMNMIPKLKFSRNMK